VCALGVGVVEVLSQSFLPGRWTDAVVFGTIMIVILLRPNGVFGAKA